MWIAPAILAAPFLSKRNDPGQNPRLRGLLRRFRGDGRDSRAGSCGSYSTTGRQRSGSTCIMPYAPHLFEMPVLGYLGFVPFALAR